MPVRATTLVSRSRRGLSNDMQMSLQIACAGCANRTSPWRHDGRGPCSSEQKKTLGVSREKQTTGHDLTIPVGWKMFGGTFIVTHFSRICLNRARQDDRQTPASASAPRPDEACGDGAQLPSFWS